MPLKRAQEHIVTLRRKAVSEARLRGMTLEEIAIWLENEELVNPETKKPYSVSTISKDLAYIEGQWNDEVMAGTDNHRARVLAQLGHVKKAAWKAGKLDTVLRAIGREVDLLGLNELDRMGVEIALMQILKGLPEGIAGNLKKIMSQKLLERKRDDKSKVINISRAR